MAKSILPLLLFWLAAAPFFAQKQPPPLLNVFLDFYNPPFEPGFLKSEIAFVNYVRDPALCDVQVQQTTELPGNDASRAVLFFFGRGRFEGLNDTASFVIQPAENQGIVRERLLRAFKKGLLKYLIQTEWAASIDYALPGADNTPVRDGWNLWTYNVDLNGSILGNRFTDNNGFFGTYSHTVRYTQLDGGLNIWHIGQRWRFGSGLRYAGNHEREELVNFPAFPVALDTVYHRTSERLLLDVGVARALGERFSVGLFLDAQRSYSASQPGGQSLRHYLETSAGIEYSFVPYREWFRRRLVVGYLLGYETDDNVIYAPGPTASPLLQTVYAGFAKVDKWGYITASAQGRYQFSRDFWSLFSAYADAKLGINLRRNIFLTVGGDLTWSNRQQSSTPTVYSRNARSLRYSSEIGIAYYFGSGFQNIINPRMWQAGSVF